MARKRPGLRPQRRRLWKDDSAERAIDADDDATAEAASAFAAADAAKGDLLAELAAVDEPLARASTFRPIALTSFISICRGIPRGWNNGTAASIASFSRRSRLSVATSATSSAKPILCWKRWCGKPRSSANSSAPWGR
jgi:hypothetical protein